MYLTCNHSLHKNFMPSRSGCGKMDSDTSCLWSSLTLAPIDITFGLSEACRADPNPNKVNMAIGIYATDDGKPYVLPIVRKVEKVLLDKQLDKEYAGIMGDPKFRKVATELALGIDSKAVQTNRCATAQTVAGTSALRVIAEFLSKHYPYDNKTVYQSDYTWPNHPTIFKEAGLSIGKYRYYNPSTGGLDAKGLYEDLTTIPEHSIILFQACSHNPTGVDPNDEEWSEISRICKERSHFIVFDVTYLGFASGDIDRDAYGLRRTVSDGNNVAFCQSFSKNFGLYGERAGSIGIVCSSSTEREIVESRISKVIRPLYSNPPVHGARIVTEILGNTQYRAEWTKELRDIFDHVHRKRELFHQCLVSKGSSKRDWSFVMNQKGWFCFTGITDEQAERLQSQYGIYNRIGRVPIVALPPKDIEYSAQAIYEVTNNKN